MHTVWFRKLEQRVRERRQARVEHLATGGAAIDGGRSVGEEYQRQVGMILGLEEVLILAEEIDKEMLGQAHAHQAAS